MDAVQRLNVGWDKLSLRYSLIPYESKGLQNMALGGYCREKATAQRKIEVNSYRLVQ